MILLYLILASLYPLIYTRAQPFGLLKPRLLYIIAIDDNVGIFVERSELNFKADILQLGIELQRVLSTFTPDPRFFGTTKRGPEVAQKPTVHPGNSTVDPCRNLVCFLDVLSPQRGSKAAFCIVGKMVFRNSASTLLRKHYLFLEVVRDLWH